MGPDMQPIRRLIAPLVALGLVALAVPAGAASLAGYGFRSGVAASTFHGDFAESFGSDYRTGFSGSLFCRFSLGRLFSIQPELGWTSKGDEGDLAITYIPPTGPVTPTTTTLGFEHRIDYLEIPLLLRLGIPNDSSFEPFLVVGPGVAFRTGSGMETTPSASQAAQGYPRVQGASIFENVGTFDSPNVQDVDWTAIAGAGVALGRAPFRVVVESRYALGLASVFPEMDARNGSWITTIGIELR